MFLIPMAPEDYGNFWLREIRIDALVTMIGMIEAEGDHRPLTTPEEILLDKLNIELDDLLKKNGHTP